jgi:peroxiredoxin
MRIGILATLLAVGSTSCASNPKSGPQIDGLAGKRAQLDQPVPDFTLRDLSRDEPTFVSLSDFRGKTVVLYFLSHQCQTSWRYEGRIGQILAWALPKGVVFLGVRSSSQDKDDATRKYVESKNLEMPVLADDRNVLADYFGIPQTPLFVVIDPQGRFRYWGSLDDHVNETRAKVPHLRNAIDAAQAGREAPVRRGLGLG